MIDKDGLYFIIPPLFSSLFFYFAYFGFGSSILLYCVFVLLLFSLAMTFFFRDPKREIPECNKLVLSPADGKIIKIDNGQFGNNPGLSIFLSPLDVHINRMPVSGKVVEIKKRHGVYLAAYKPEAEIKNEAIETQVSTDFGMVIVRQVVGVLARRLVNRLEVGSDVKCGQKFGLMRFGSRMDLILPQNVEFTVKEGDKVKGGVSVIGRFIDA